MSKWEQIAEGTYRMKVHGGWLVRYANVEGIAMVFVSDPQYQWKLEQSGESQAGPHSYR